MAQVLAGDRLEQECLHPEVVGPMLVRLLPLDDAGVVADWFATLADRTRARIVQALSLAPELCVCDLAFALGMSVSALSHQLRYLRERSIVRRRKAGRIAYYSLADEHVRHVLTDALLHATEPAPAADASAADAPAAARTRAPSRIA